MKFEYKTTEEDHLAFQLFAATKSARLMKQKKVGRLFFTLAFLAIAVYCYLKGNLTLAIIFTLYASTVGFLYPRFFRWRYKRHYTKHNKEHRSKLFDEITQMEISKDHILTKSKSGEGKFYVAEMDHVNETSDHFFIQLSTGPFLIVPKQELDDPTELKNKFAAIGLELKDETDWKW